MVVVLTFHLPAPRGPSSPEVPLAPRAVQLTVNVDPDVAMVVLPGKLVRRKLTLMLTCVPFTLTEFTEQVIVSCTPDRVRVTSMISPARKLL